MSATPPTALEGTQSPSQIELIWDRYRNLVYVVVVAALGALGAHYAWTEYERKQADKVWSEFATTLGLDATYTDNSKVLESLTESVGALDLAKLEAAANAAPAPQRPYVLMAVARRAVADKLWDKAEGALAELERQFPNHSLLKVSDYPVQAVEMIKPSKDGIKQDTNKKPEFKPAEKGSAVSLMREQIAKAKTYAAPSQFARTEIPADAPKVKYELSDGGTFVVAVVAPPKHREEFLKLVDSGFWKGLAIDEIRRPSKNRKNARELHFGLESTRGVDDREKWTDTEASKYLVDFEDTNFSHFAGAVSARNAAEGKSCVDRLWISVEDTPKYDGDRVILGYVVEGLDTLKRVCDSAMTAQEEEQGIGKPSDSIRIVGVTKL